MNISRQEAGAALDSIQDASAAVKQRRIYAHAAPYFILWGSIWAVCNSITQFWPEWAGRGWQVGQLIGLVITAWLTVRLIRCERAAAAERPGARDHGTNFALLGVTLICYFIAMFTVLAPISGRRMGAFISLFWTLAYMAAGAWAGVRLFVIGAVGTAGILLSYLYAGDYFPLAVAIAGGGTLIVGGLWLRRL